MTTSTKAPENLLKKLRSGHRYVITSHINPDGDAVGSSLGLVRILRAIGKGAVVWSRDETPKLYRQLAGSERMHIGAEPPNGFPDSFDCAIVLECPTLDRCGLEEHLADMPVINIDHHLGNEHYGEVNWVDTAAPSLGEMIYRLSQGLMVNLDQETATALYLTLVTDTGGFRFANATPAAFAAASALVTEGAQPQQVAHWLYESQPESAVRLLGEMLKTLEIHEDRVATAIVTLEMFDNAGASPSDTEGLIDHPRSIAGVDAVALLRQVDDKRFKVSLRSRGDIDVEKLARQHGGGGHRNAAGYMADGPIEDLRPSVVSQLQTVLS
jgi:phosphoesterase RecJ-like protein